MQNTASNDKNTFFSAFSNKSEGEPFAPYPPDPPAYCTRQSVKQMKENSTSLTQQELKKLEESKPPLTSNRITCVPSVEFNPDMHKIMCKYAEKQQQLCNQLCDLNQRLQKKQDDCISLKNLHQLKVTELREELEHIQEINTANEDEIVELQQKLSHQEQEHNSYKKMNERSWMYQPFVIICIVVIHSILCLEMSKHFSFDVQESYNSLAHFILYPL